MFGYVVVNDGELKIKDYRKYRAYYCGLCQSLKKDYGKRGQITVSFDMTFLVLLLTALYEPETKVGSTRCIAHPFVKHETLQNKYSEYAADMNVLLSYLKCLDDWQDEKKLVRYLFGKSLQGKTKKMQRKYEKKTAAIIEAMKKIAQCEQEDNRDIDAASGHFGEVMAEIFAYQRDEWEEQLRKCGFFLGKFIYLMDAYEDVEADIESGNYNVLKERYKEAGFDEKCKEILTMMMAECSKAFEILPIVDEIDILRNILYSGVWMRYEKVLEGRKEKRTEDGSI